MWRRGHVYYRSAKHDELHLLHSRWRGGLLPVLWQPVRKYHDCVELLRNSDEPLSERFIATLCGYTILRRDSVQPERLGFRMGTIDYIFYAVLVYLLFFGGGLFGVSLGA
jgi:hypothetical protein